MKRSTRKPSFDYAITEGELFVPDALCYPPDATTPHHGGRQHEEVGLVGFTSWGHTGWALGVGRRILDELARHARERKPEIVLRDSAPPFDLARPNHFVDRYRQLTIERREV